MPAIATDVTVACGLYVRPSVCHKLVTRCQSRCMMDRIKCLSACMDSRVVQVTVQW